MDGQNVREFFRRYVEAVAADFDAGLERYVADPGLKEHGRITQEGFPGYHIEPIETVAEGNKIAVYATMHGTHRGPFMGIEPTGRDVAVPFMIIYHVEDEKIVDHQIVINERVMLEQLGVLPQSQPAHQ